jgi:hypothetical protein
MGKLLSDLPGVLAEAAHEKTHKDTPTTFLS